MKTAIAATALALFAFGAVAQDKADRKPREEPSIDGSYTGEVIGEAAPGDPFGKLKIGMNTGQVQEVMDRVPDRQHSYESGKRWIPFYGGNDARRMQVLYKGEGCLMFTGGNVWGSSGGDLIGIHHDASGACYQP